MKDKPIVLIMCGGRSKRLWPLSKYKSKNFLDIFGFSPLQETIKRFERITPCSRIFCVTGIKDKGDVFKIKKIKKNNIFIEPVSKNTAPAILLSLLKLKAKKNSSLIISPVDHLIKNEKSFYKALYQAISETKEEGICTLAIKPKVFNPDFGYIQAGKKEKKAYKIEKFIEKPNAAKAKKLLKKKNCFYNSGIFITSVDFLLGEYKKYYPHYQEFKASSKGKVGLNKLYKKIGSEPFDKVIMEKTKKAKLVKANFYWQDFGSWQTIYSLLKKDKNGNVKQGDIAVESGSKNFIFSNVKGKKTLVAGLSDCFIVDTPRYTLIANQESVKKIKEILNKFELG